MPRNVEITARLVDPRKVLEMAVELGDQPPRIIPQTDTFFHTERGRLKVRDFGDGTGELIYYERPDRRGPKTSSYAISPTPDPVGLASLLGAAYPTAGVVKKTRTLLMAGRTRIHIDEVQGLGWFMELEVVLAEDESTASGEAEVRDLMARLGVSETDLVTGAYIDLLGEGPKPVDGGQRS